MVYPDGSTFQLSSVFASVCSDMFCFLKQIKKEFLCLFFCIYLSSVIEYKLMLTNLYLPVFYRNVNY